MRHKRRDFLSHTSLGVVGILGSKSLSFKKKSIISSSTYKYYPTTLPEDISAVVGAAHSNLDKVKELVDARPELAKATWDWGFGDVESALGAASHMGRKDIAEYLIKMGARPDIYTFAMLGKIDTVKSMINDLPGIESILGPHGFTLMHHAKIRLLRKNVKGEEKESQQELVNFLESLGTADIGQESMPISDEEKSIYVGQYTFGEGEDEYFDVKLNSRKMLSLGRGSYFGRGLHKVGEYTFTPGGGPSVRIVFEIEDGHAKSVSILDPEVVITAYKK